MAKRRDVALLLQFEAHAIDAAGGVDGEDEGEIDGLPAFALRGSRTGDNDKKQ